MIIYSYKKHKEVGKKWDIAFTPDGILILEANDNPHIVMMQISCKGIKSNSIYNEVFKKYIR